MNFNEFNLVRESLRTKKNNIQEYSTQLYQLSQQLEKKAVPEVGKRINDIIDYNEYFNYIWSELEILISFLIRCGEDRWLLEITDRALKKIELRHSEYWVSIAVKYDMMKVLKSFEEVHHNELKSNDYRFLTEKILYAYAESNLSAPLNFVEYLYVPSRILQEAALECLSNDKNILAFIPYITTFFKQTDDSDFIIFIAEVLKENEKEAFFDSLIKDKISSLRDTYYQETVNELHALLA